MHPSSLRSSCPLNRLPKGPRSILFREFLPIMKPLLDELRDIARQRKKTVSQVIEVGQRGEDMEISRFQNSFLSMFFIVMSTILPRSVITE